MAIVEIFVISDEGAHSKSFTSQSDSVSMMFLKEAGTALFFLSRTREASDGEESSLCLRDAVESLCSTKRGCGALREKPGRLSDCSSAFASAMEYINGASA